ncbi:MAG: diguanylate cyclase [Negativicutes bacterium]|nr:diguanylate cyclase [Negativicutes bacterium]
MFSIHRLASRIEEWGKHQRISLYMGLIALGLIAVMWLFTLSRVNFEHETEIQSVMRANGNLAMAFEENVRQELRQMDEVLLYLKGEYEKNGRITPVMLSRIESTKSLPVVHISLTDAQGRYVVSSRPDFVGLDISAGDVFVALSQPQGQQPYIAKPTIGRITKQWLFHVARRLNNPDGSFAGVAVVAVDNSYFADFYRKMQLPKEYLIALTGRDGIIRLRQMGERSDAGMDISQAPMFRYVEQAPSGAYVGEGIVDKVRRIFSYRAMPDYPLVLSVSVSKAEALNDFYQRRDRYYTTATVASLVLVGVFGLLIWVVEALRRSRTELERRVVQRTSELEDANEELQAVNEELKRLSLVDGMTGLANRRYFDDYLQHEWRSAQRRKKPLAMIMGDVDFFKNYNDIYGHQFGDECLKSIAAALRNGVERSTDLVARYGGEEFAIILPDTDAQGALFLAEKLRSEIEALGMEHRQSPEGHVTISLGVAAIVPNKKSGPMGLITAADMSLYQAKQAGRNCVKLAESLDKLNSEN